MVHTATLVGAPRACVLLAEPPACVPADACFATFRAVRGAAYFLVLVLELDCLGRARCGAWACTPVKHGAF